MEIRIEGDVEVMDMVLVGEKEFPSHLVDNLEDGIRGYESNYKHEFLLADFSVIDEDDDAYAHYVAVIPRKGKVKHFIDDEEESEISFDPSDIEKDEVKAQILEFVIDICEEYGAIEVTE